MGNKLGPIRQGFETGWILVLWWGMKMYIHKWTTLTHVMSFMAWPYSLPILWSIQHTLRLWETLSAPVLGLVLRDRAIKHNRIILEESETYTRTRIIINETSIYLSMTYNSRRLGASSSFFICFLWPGSGFTILESERYIHIYVFNHTRSRVHT